MKQIWAVATNTFRQTVRERLFYNVLIFGVGIVLLGMVMANITFGYPDRVVRSVGLSGMSIALDLMALLVGVNLIHSEIDRKTLFVLLTRPVARWQYAASRYLGLLMSLAVAAFGLAVIFSITLVMVQGEPTLTDAVTFGMSYVEATVIGGVGLVLSAFSTPTLSAGMGLGLWIAAATTDDLVRLTEKAGGALHELVRVVYFALPALSRFNFREIAIYQLPILPLDYITAAAYGFLWDVILLAIASMILSRREMV